MEEIPYIFEHVSTQFPNDYEFYDMAKTRNCLRKRRILLLGDSTMSEFFHDVAILISGSAHTVNSRVNSHFLDDYVRESTVNKVVPQTLPQICHNLAPE